MKDSTRVIFNTVVQYFRTLITVLISLYTTRIVLDQLGAEDYGLYYLIGGLISMLAFIRTSLASTTQRYLSFHQGRKDLEMQRTIFNNSVITQFLISIILVLILLFVQPILFNGFLNIPSDRIHAAKWVYRLMVGTIFFSMQSTPYYATLIAHENILFSTIVQIIEVSLKIPIALSLAVAPIDRLIFYAFLLFLVNFLSFIFYYIYSKRTYAETRHIRILSFRKKVFKDMFSFMGWVVYSTGCVVGRTQGLAILLNKVVGPAINAAYGIAWHLTGQLSFLSSSIMNAINPQIIRAEGEQNRVKMLRLSEIASKFSFLLLSMISIPAIIEMDALLKLWLKEVPEYTVAFSQFIVLTNLADQLTIGLVTANKAIGNIKAYSITINTIKLLSLPTSIIFLWIGLPLISVMISLFFFELVCALARLPFLSKTGGLSISGFAQRVFLYEIAPIILTLLSCIIFANIFNFRWSFLCTFIISGIVMIFSSYAIGFCKDEKAIINKLISSIVSKLRIRLS